MQLYKLGPIVAYNGNWGSSHPAVPSMGTFNWCEIYNWGNKFPTALVSLYGVVELLSSMIFHYETWKFSYGLLDGGYALTRLKHHCARVLYRHPMQCWFSGGMFHMTAVGFVSLFFMSLSILNFFI